MTCWVTKYLLPNWQTLFLLVVLLYLLYRYSIRNHNYWKIRGVPFEKPVYLAGSLWEVFKGKRHIGKHLGYLYSKYDTPYFGIYIMGKPYLVLRKPSIIKTITIRDFNNFEDRTFACDKEADAMSGNSLFILRNPDWKNIRNKLTPIFTSGKLKMMFPIMKQSSREMLVYLNKHEDEVLDIKEISAKFMTDVVASCFFGLEINSFGDVDSEFRAYSRKMFDFDAYTSFCLFSYFFVPKFVSWFKLKMLDSSFLQRVLHETLNHRKKTNVKRNDFVDLLLQIRDNFSDSTTTHFDTDTMVSQAITFFVAGFETTSNALAFALYELCLRQDCQDKLRREIHENIHGDEDISFENIQKMKYLDMVLCVCIYMLHCVVCGANEDEVVKLFCFPRKEEKSKKWQSAMGMCYQGLLSGHIRICKQHFTDDCFVPCTMPLRLRRDAVPSVLVPHASHIFRPNINQIDFIALTTLCIYDRMVSETWELYVAEDRHRIRFEKRQIKADQFVIGKTLRRYPFGPFLNRKCKEDYVLKETGLLIEKDTPILVPIDGIHNDPEYYPDPEKFDPERFIDGHKQKSQSCTYLPFGMGPRNCIGDRFGLICAKLGLVCFLKEFKVEQCKHTPIPLILDPKSPFMMPIEGLRMTVKKA